MNTFARTANKIRKYNLKSFVKKTIVRLILNTDKDCKLVYEQPKQGANGKEANNLSKFKSFNCLYLLKPLKPLNAVYPNTNGKASNQIYFRKPQLIGKIITLKKNKFRIIKKIL